MPPTDDKHRDTSYLLPDNIVEKLIKGLGKNKTFDITGYQIAVIRDLGFDRDLEPHGLGHPAGEIDGVPVVGETTWPLGEASQLITIVALEKALQLKKYELSTPIKLILSELELAEEGVADKITCIDIISHMTGLPSFGEMGDEDINKDNIMEKLSTISPAHPYRSKYHYSTLPWLLIEVIIEKLTEKDFATFVQDEIFVPQRMKFSSVEKGYNERACRGVKTNARDMLKFFPYLSELPIYGQLLQSQGGKVQYHFEPSQDSVRCLGFSKTIHNDIVTYENYSSFNEYGSLIVILPEYQTTLVVFCKKIEGDDKENREDFMSWVRTTLIDYHSDFNVDQLRE